ncbi:MAG: hypothetical protein CMF96_05545 [Candidatus Marinimicrobia bacterium]|nr:hypothetical protein [Candidatus Neomarinimicrobiota bacterium]
MNFLESIKSVLKNVLQFDGRASRSEYNYWMIFLFFIFLIAIEVDPPNPVSYRYLNNNDSQTIDLNSSEKQFLPPFESRLFSFAYFVFLLPTISVTVRRFHDTGKSGWFILLPLTIIGLVPYHYWTCISKGDIKKNAYGKNPLNNVSV